MSKLVKCKVCDKEIEKGVKKCVSCGKDQRSFFGKYKILTGLAVVIILGVIANAGNSDTATTVASNDKVTSSAPVVKEFWGVKEVLASSVSTLLFTSFCA